MKTLRFPLWIGCTAEKINKCGIIKIETGKCIKKL